MLIRLAFIPALVILLGVSLAQGQVVYDWENRAENFHYRVKNIEFFIDRFNNQPEGSGSARAANPKDTAACIAFMKERDVKLFSLFDMGKLDKTDQNLKKKINTFFRDINSPYDPKFIRFVDTYWYAELTMTVLEGGHPKKLRCIMQVVPLGQGAVGWAIKSFHSTELSINERFFTNKLTFPPSVNGTDFMGVRLALNNPEWTSSKIGKPEMPNSATLQQLSDGKLKVESIGKITYHFLQLDGWIMTVNYVNRESKNSGWLLDSLKPATVEEKVKYLKDLSID
jgi:hypothetical protein